MATVIMHAVVSVDGFIADENDDVGPLFDWYFNGDRPLVDDAGEAQHSPFRVSGVSREYVAPFWASIGATVMGRRLFDQTNGWDGRPPAGDHLVVVADQERHLGLPRRDHVVAADRDHLLAQHEHEGDPGDVVDVREAGDVALGQVRHRREEPVVLRRVGDVVVVEVDQQVVVGSGDRPDVGRPPVAQQDVGLPVGGVGGRVCLGHG